MWPVESYNVVRYAEGLHPSWLLKNLPNKACDENPSLSAISWTVNREELSSTLASLIT